MSETLLKNADLSGVYYLPASRRSTIESAGRRLRYGSLTADIAQHSSIEDVLRHLGTTLKFPSWYGANFDALFDCLIDPEWQPGPGHVLQIHGIAPMRAAAPDELARLTEVLQAAADARRDLQAPFWILLDAPARGVPMLPDA